MIIPEGINQCEADVAQLVVGIPGLPNTDGFISGTDVNEFRMELDGGPVSKRIC
jgi:hypothetical protein